MAYPLFLTVRPTPAPEKIPALRCEVEQAFPLCENRTYLDALCSSPLPRVTAQRLGALSLLASLLSEARIPTESLILRRDEHGRPYCETADGALPFCGLTGAPSSFDFNLSHTDHHVAAALLVGDGKVGLDIEEPIPPTRALPLIRRYCTAGELAIFGCPDDENAASSFFTFVWVMREAMAKQEGGGMPLRFDVANLPAGVWMWNGYLPDTNTAIALCAPKGNAPSRPRLTSDSIRFTIE